jgi:hypothetical protein
MIKNIIIIALAASVVSSGAFAQDGGEPSGCRYVQITREGVNPEKPDVALTFRGYGSDVDAIDACNQDTARSNVIGVDPSPTAGARVMLRTSNGSGMIALPTAFESGDVHQVTCAMEGGQVVARLYRTRWQGGLPNQLTLQDESNSLVGGMAIHQKKCEEARLPDSRGQQKVRVINKKS